MRRAWDAVFSAALSPPCATCGRVLDEPLAGAVCRACWSSVRVLSPPLCDRCGYPIAHDRETRLEPSAWGAGLQPCSVPGGGATDLGDATRVVSDVGDWADTRPRTRCVGCAELRVVDRARALGAYEGVLREVLHALKYAGRRSTAPHLARLLRERHPDLLHGVDAVVPVPLHPRRAWTRGFNQAALVAARLGPPVVHALRRRRHTSPQAGIPAERRAANVADAFAPSLRARLQPWLVRDACLVLVDDVSTTGATLDACARVLKACGAREVRAITVARTLKHGVRPGPGVAAHTRPPDMKTT
jgi:ComF family protein